MSTAEGNQAPSSPAGGKTEFAEPVFRRIVRQAVASIPGLQLEPLDSGNPLAKFLHRKRGQVTARKVDDRLELNVPLQVEHGRRIPELAGEAQRAVAAEIQRLLGYQEVSVNLRVVGLFTRDEEGDR
ncbi:MAG: Asp23/Gls24 family envelope stress response protein [Planctomycetota bacterium]